MTDEGREHGHEHDTPEAETIVTGLLVTKRVEGDVTAVLDVRAAAAAGAAYGAAYFLLKLLFGR